MAQDGAMPRRVLVDVDHVGGNLVDRANLETALFPELGVVEVRSELAVQKKSFEARPLDQRPNCIDCGGEIPQARRVAYPQATTCLLCQRIREESRRR